MRSLARKARFPTSFGTRQDPNKPAEREVICVDNGDAQLLDIDAINEFANPSLDMTPYQCRVEKLSAIELPAG